MRFSALPVGSLTLIIVAVGILLTLLVVGPARGRISRSKRLVLTGLRTASIGLLLFAMLRPAVVYTEVKQQSATLVVAIDRSRSMTVQDAYNNQSRWDALRQVLDNAREQLAAIGKDLEIRAYTFASDAENVPFEAGAIELPEAADGEQTAIGASLDEILTREADKRLVGMVVLSDGAQRAYAPRDMPPEVVARRLYNRGVKVYAVPFGQAIAAGDARDVALDKLQLPQSVFVKNDLLVGAQLQVQGYPNERIPVLLEFEAAGGSMPVVAQETLPAEAEPQAVEVIYAPETPGEYKVRLRVEPLPGEVVTTNNELSSFVTVTSGGLRVLYLEGALRPEARFLRGALDSSPDVDVDFVRMNAAAPETRPADLADRLRPGQYDVYVIGDLDSTAFADGELEQLVETVERGAGLIMLGGLHSFGPGGYADTPLADLLPVEMSNLERQQFNEPVREDVHLTQPQQMRPTTAGTQHFIMRLGPGAENGRIWESLPPLDGANRFSELPPRALVLADSAAGQPLLVARDYGGGRVLAFAGDSTWRWPLAGNVEEHRRFWRQVTLWLARKDESSEGSVWLRLAQRRYAPGSRVTFTAGARTPEGDPIEDAQFKATIKTPAGQTESVGVYRELNDFMGSFAETAAAGDYLVQLEASDASGAPLGTAQARFLVFDRDLELDNPAADPELLLALVEATEGAETPPELFGQLLDEIQNSPLELEFEEVVKYDLWDNWPFFILLVGCLCTEWFLRKRWGLV